MLKKSFILIILSLLFLAPVQSRAADKWTTEDKVLQAFVLTLKAADWRQTRYHIKDPDNWELNPLLGRRPSALAVDAYFLTTAVLHTVITHHLPQKYRKYWQGIWIGISGTCVLANAGIIISF